MAATSPPFTHRVLLGLCIYALLPNVGTEEGGCDGTTPCVHGVCVDVPEYSTYRCYCTDGYTGYDCQTDYDDCRSLPCLFGGTCVDQVAGFRCLCSGGYTGESCETDIDECRSDPCLNGGSCTDDVDGFFCSCLPGYKGWSLCEIDVSVCNDTATCYNGGTCVEGPGDSFLCRCAPGFVGEFCQSDVNECPSRPCHNGGRCQDHPGGFFCSCEFGWTGEVCEVRLQECDSNDCLNGGICFVPSPAESLPPSNVSSECFCVPDYHGTRCESRYDECIPGSPCHNGGTCIDGVDDYSCSCNPDFTGKFCEASCYENKSICETLQPESVSFTETHETIRFHSATPTWSRQTGDVETTEALSTPSSFSRFTPSVSSSSFNDGVAVFPSWTPSVPEGTSDSTTTLQKSSTVIKVLPPSPWDRSDVGVPVSDSPSVFQSKITTYFSYVTTGAIASSSTLLDMTTLQTTITWDEHESHAERSMSQQTPPFIMSPTSGVLTWLSPELSYVATYEFSTTARAQPGVTIPSHLPDISHFTSVTSYPQTAVLMDTASYYSVYSPSSIASMWSDAYESSSLDHRSVPMPSSSRHDSARWLETSMTDSSLTKTFYKEVSTFSPEISSSTVRSVTSPWPNGTVDAFEICAHHACFNGGTPVVNSRAASSCECRCPLNFSGPQCQLDIKVRTPQFKGSSFLEHLFASRPGDSVLDLELSFATDVHDGLLLYVDGGEPREGSFVGLFLKDGVLRFAFACGHHRMVFIQSARRVDTGFFTAVTIELTWLTLPESPSGSSCTAVLRVNGSDTQTGHQPAILSQLKFGRAYLGGFPPGFEHPEDVSGQGFIGCIGYFQVNRRELDLVQDAKAGADISPCRSRSCAGTHCPNGSLCSSEDAAWPCRCSEGRLGVRCRTNTCDSSPCLGDALCVNATEGPRGDYICLCPYGKTGRHCESNVTITEMSFQRGIRWHSSYVELSVPMDTSDSIEFRLTFSIDDPLQTALLAFIGQEDGRDPMSDFMTVLLYGGRIWLYFDLGSGTTTLRSPTTLDASLPLHEVVFGHHRRYGWLKADDQVKAVGLSEGPLNSLNVAPSLFVGGHPSVRLAGLPKLDVELRAGFVGCVRSVEVRGCSREPFRPLKDVLSGRNVNQCQEASCTTVSCKNGSSCIPGPETASCYCADDKAWTRCGVPRNVCLGSGHACADGSFCTPLSQGYRCECPLGKMGRHCEIGYQLENPRFLLDNSYLALAAPDVRRRINFRFRLRVEGPDGLIFQIARREGSRAADYATLALSGGYLKFSFNLGTGPGTDTVIRSRRRLSMGHWEAVEVGREDRDGYLVVDGDRTSGQAPRGMVALNTDTPIILGKMAHQHFIVSTMSALKGIPSFRGCISQLEINNCRSEFTDALGGLNIVNCQSPG
ncbi:unnamed protein product [Ixodes hexagonus]